MHLQSQFTRKDLGKLKYFVGIEMVYKGISAPMKDLLEVTKMPVSKPTKTPMIPNQRYNDTMDSEYVDATRYR